MEIEHAVETTPSQTSLLIVAFFSLSCFYFMLTVLSIYRTCTLEHTTKPNEPNILRTFLLMLTTATVLRLLGWLLCTAFYFMDNKTYIKHATYE